MGKWHVVSFMIRDKIYGHYRQGITGVQNCKLFNVFLDEVTTFLFPYFQIEFRFVLLTLS